MTRGGYREGEDNKVREMSHVIVAGMGEETDKVRVKMSCRDVVEA